MGGDSAIAHELSSRLAEDVYGERFEELARNYKLYEQYLSAEWVSLLYRLREEELEKDQSFLTPDVYAYAAKQSESMRQIDFLDGRDLSGLSDGELDYLQGKVKSMYYAHNGVHSMSARRDRLEVGAEILVRHMDRSNHPDSFTARQAANFYEELAFYDMLAGASSANLEMARELNQRVIESVPSWGQAYKIHALYSLFDLEANELLVKTRRVGKDSRRDLEQLHGGFNAALDYIGYELNQYYETAKANIGRLNGEEADIAARQAQGNLFNMSGVLAEGLALSVVQGYLLDSGLYDKYWARQAYLREDTMGARRLANPQDEGPGEILNVPNMSFDLQIFDYREDGDRIPIEVKKRERPSPSSLHPDIKVITFQDSRSALEFARYVRGYAQSQIARRMGKRMTSRQKKIAKEVSQRVDPARLFRR